MKRRIFATIVALIITAVVSAQEVTVDHFGMNQIDMTAKLNPVLDLNDDPCALIRVAVASSSVTFQGNIVQEPEYVAGEWLVYMPQGSRRLKISVAGCLPLTFEFDEEIEEFRAYELRLKMPSKRADRTRVLLMPIYSTDGANTSFGGMFGFAKKGGLYISYKSNFESVSTAVDIDADGVEVESGTERWLTGATKVSRMSFGAGYIQRLAKPLYIYLGGGYGQRTYALEMVNGEYGKVVESSFDGMEVTAGMIFRIGAVALTAAAQYNSFEYMEANVGFGLMF